MSIGPSAIRVNAVLSAFRDGENSDVIDALCYFFVPILDKISGKPVTASLLAKAAKLIYGWKITESVGQVFIERLAAHGHLEREEQNGKDYFIAQPSSDLGGDLDHSIYESFEEVTVLFRNFDLVSGDLLYSQLTGEELGDLLVRFLISLDAYSNEEIAAELKSGSVLSEESEALRALSNDVSVPTQSEAHVCARFVQWLGFERPELAEKLGLFVAAGLLAELVEDFRKPSAVETQSDTTFFLDGPMLLGLVGTSGNALQDEARIIVEALKSIGCRVQVFSESCREAERVLSAYLLAQSSNRHGRTHTAVLKGEVDRNYVQTVASDIEKAAETFGVNVRDYGLDAYPNDHKFFNSERNDDIYSFLSWENPQAREHDAFAVTAIMRMRQGRSKNDPLDNSHVFISSNEKLVEKARDYCLRSQLVRENQCGPVVDTRDMATIAWLRTGFEHSEKLPISHMLAQCERVLRVRKTVIETARTQVARFSAEKVEQFELLLQDNRAVNYLMDTARGTSASFDPDQDRELLDGMLEAAIKVTVDDSKRKISEKNKVIRSLKKEHEEARVQWEAEHARHEEEVRQSNLKVAERVAGLEAAQERDREALKEVHKRQDGVIDKVVRRVNWEISATQFVAGTVLVAVGFAAIAGVFIPQPPEIADYALKAFTVVGLAFTIQALRGRGVIGLAHISEAVGRKRYLRYCLAKGVPEEIAADRIFVEHGRLKLSEVLLPTELIIEVIKDAEATPGLSKSVGRK